MGDHLTIARPSPQIWHVMWFVLKGANSVCVCVLCVLGSFVFEATSCCASRNRTTAFALFHPNPWMEILG